MQEQNDSKHSDQKNNQEKAESVYMNTKPHDDEGSSDKKKSETSNTFTPQNVLPVYPLSENVIESLKDKKYFKNNGFVSFDDFFSGSFADYFSYGQCNISKWTDTTAVAVGKIHTVGLKSNGKAVVEGDNIYNVSSWRDIVAISTGGEYTLWLKSDGTVIPTGLSLKEIFLWQNIKIM